MVPQNCSVSHMIVSLSMYCPWYIQNNWIELVIESQACECGSNREICRNPALIFIFKL